MKCVLSALVLAIALSGCTGARHATKDGTPVAKTVAVMPFSSVSGGAVGEEVADWLALKLMENGYVVIDRSRTTSVVSEKKFYEAGLNDDVRTLLQAQKLTAVVYGSITEFGCETRKAPALSGTIVPKNYCNISVTAKMAETATGKLLWGLMLKDSAAAPNLTAEQLMRSLMERTDIASSLPAVGVEALEPEIKAAPVK